MKKRLFEEIKLNSILLLIFIIYFLLNKFIKLSIPCMFHEITGLLCPGCGITRCLFCIVNGDFISAFNYNKLVFVLLPFFIIFYIADAIYYVKKDDRLYNKINNKFYIALLVVVLLFGIVRNII